MLALVEANLEPVRQESLQRGSSVSASRRLLDASRGRGYVTQGKMVAEHRAVNEHRPKARETR